MPTKEQILNSFKPKLAPNAETVVRKRYMKVNEKGDVCETVPEMLYRVSNFMASADSKWSANLDYSQTTREFYQMLAAIDFLPGGRAFFEAGNNYTGQMASCFVFPVDDSLDDIFATLKDAAITQQNNGGCGFNFSRIRSRGSSVKGVPNVACGPIHYLKTFDHAFSQILQGGKRHGGNMGVLNVDHPDILEFINLKGRESAIKNFNISVGVSDRFMEAVRNDEAWKLIDPQSQVVRKTVRARVLFDMICRKAWECADPGMLFLDAMERGNHNPNLGRMDTTNPCGEQPLLPYESCNLGSFNLSNFVIDNAVDWERLRGVVCSAVHFMDNMIELNKYPIPAIASAVWKTRKIGLGVMGFAHMLYKMRIPYNSQQAVDLLERLMKFIQEEGLLASCELAKIRGPFEEYERSTFVGTPYRPRNSMITSIAPTGTISLFANTTSGIEPQFSLVTIRNTFFEGTGSNTASTSLLYVDEIFEETAKEEGFYSEELMQKIAEEGSVQHIDAVPDHIKRVFVTAHDIAPEWHVRAQGAAQKWTDAAVSKTINMPHTAGVEDVKRVYILAYELRCKGITIYRDGSKETQVLNIGVKAKHKEEVSRADVGQKEDDTVASSAEVKSDWRYSSDIPLTDNAMNVLQRRAFLKDETGQFKETPEQLFERVAHAVACAEERYDTPVTTVRHIEQDYYDMLSRLEFVPGQALRNAGSGEGLTLSACLVLSIEDSMESILRAISENVIAHKATCGTGFNYSHLRSKGSMVENVGPVAAGPLAFMRTVTTAQKTVWTKGGRQQGSMAILNVDHPDIEDFITCKDDLEAFDNINISVGITDRFMRAVVEDRDYDLVDPHTKKVVRREKAKKIFHMIAQHAWVSGDPGMIMLDRLDRDNPTPALGKLEATNPCGEQPLLPYETCNLGSVVLSRMTRKLPLSESPSRKEANSAEHLPLQEIGESMVHSTFSSAGVEERYELDWDKLSRIIERAVRFLDNTIDVNIYPFKKIEEMSKKTRRIGLGVMGFADMLIKLGIPYNSEAAVQMAEKVMKFISEKAREASVIIAQEKGNFPAFQLSVWPQKGYTHMRNSAITTIAPTGYTSVVANCSSGIEPVFALAFKRIISMGEHEQSEVHSYFKEVAQKRGFYSEELMNKVSEQGTVNNILEVPEDVRRVFVTSSDIAPEWDVKIQAAFQKYTDNAVSKTINFPNNASVEDVERAYLHAWELGCKGITIFRDGSKEQVLVSGTRDANKSEPTLRKITEAMVRPMLQPRPRPEMVSGVTYKLKTSYGNLFVTINSDEAGQPFEIFATIGKSGGFFQAKSEAICRLISLALRSGISVEDVITQIKGIRGPMASWGKNGMIYSIPDAIAQVLDEHVRKPQQELLLDYNKEEPKKIEESQAIVVEKIIPQIQAEPTEVFPSASDRSADMSASSLDLPHPASRPFSIADAGFAPECPECGCVLEFAEGCMMCRACGYSKCG